MTFEEFNLLPELMEAVRYNGFEKATPVQEQTIPIILEGRDLIACAQTGTGKTAAFLLPVLNSIASKECTHTHTLVLVPTRELAIQIDQHLQGLAYTLGITSIAIYGGSDGSDWEQQKTALSAGAQIIVATPGKLISHLNQGYVKFDKIECLVLDEADRMLDIGFYDDIIKIISQVSKERQTLMFSATMPPRIRSLSKQIMQNPAEISLEMSKPAEGVIQAAYDVAEGSKLQLIKDLIAEKPDYNSILVFCATKRKVSEIVRRLRSDSYVVEGISSDLEQRAREEVLLRFRAKQVRVMVATDVMSRGIDIKDINLVVNYDVPGDAEDYVHRIGRTARAETTGVAVTFVNRDDRDKMQRIEKLIGNKVYRVPWEAPASDREERTERPKKTYGKGRSGSSNYKGGNRQGSSYKGGERRGGGNHSGNRRSGGNRG